MSDHDRNTDDAYDEAVTPDSDAAEEMADDAAAEAETGDGDNRLAELQRERDDFEQKLLRYAADYQNLARRGEQNAAAARDQQVIDIARALVTVLDHFDRALEVDPEKVAPGDLLQGVQMVRDEMMRVLGRFGIQRVDAQPGDAFDPNRHEAMMRQPSDEIESNHVTRQFQPGYVLKDKTIRPAGVSVAE